MLKEGALRFSELERQVKGVTKKMLTSQLRELERDDIIRRKVYAQVPPRVDYTMTVHGKTLAPILELMAEWGTDHRKRYGRTPRDRTAQRSRKKTK